MLLLLLSTSKYIGKENNKMILFVFFGSFGATKKKKSALQKEKLKNRQILYSDQVIGKNNN